MKKIFKILFFVLVALFLVIQFIPSNRPDNNPVSGQDILEIETLPNEVRHLLKTACYDCHSQHVRYPWYSYVAPVSWLIARDVNIGREHLDFGKWGELTKRKKIKALEEITESVDEEFMPMEIYITMHSEANLTRTERELIMNWAEKTSESYFEN